MPDSNQSKPQRPDRELTSGAEVSEQVQWAVVEAVPVDQRSGHRGVRGELAGGDALIGRVLDDSDDLFCASYPGLRFVIVERR